MKIKSLYNFLFLLLFSYSINSCTEPYTLATNTYEEALVVEATITNELKTQEIRLTKPSRFEDTQTEIESGAEVYVTDNAGTRYDFEEESGIYKSMTEFQAKPEKEYRLNITTKDGRSFESATEKLSTINPMQSVTAALETKDNQRGFSIRVNSFDPTNQSKYYRYEYEETYKIITPRWSSIKATLDGHGGVVFSPNRNDIKVCYSSAKNIDLLLTSTTALNEDRVDYQIRFISDQNYIISHRYSILVTQYVENLASYTYYKTLDKISKSGTLVSPIQPGILNGNIMSSNNTDDKIIGYFDVASVSTERIYFNYADLLLGEPLPPYYTDCEDFCFNLDGVTPCTHSPSYHDDLENGAITFLKDDYDLKYYFWVYAPCGDCTTFSSNIKPPFWID
jgi:hypothetical protein